MPRRDQSAMLIGIRRPSAGQCFRAICLLVVYHLGLELRSEVPDKSLDRPRETAIER